MTSDGFVLGGIVNPELGQQGEVNSHSINVRVPNDVSAGGFVSVVAQLTFGGDTSNIGEITTVIKCAETGAEQTQKIAIKGNAEEGGGEGQSHCFTLLLSTAQIPQETQSMCALSVDLRRATKRQLRDSIQSLCILYQ